MQLAGEASPIQVASPARSTSAWTAASRGADAGATMDREATEVASGTSAGLW